MNKKELYGLDIPVDVFDDNITAIYGDWGMAKKYLRDKKCGGDLDTLGSDIPEDWVDGMHVQNEDGKSYVYLGRDLKNKNRIIHELMHAVLSLTWKRNLVYSDKRGEQELMCYLSAYIISYVLDTKANKWYILKNDKWVKQK